jgi:hypothetical protein
VWVRFLEDWDWRQPAFTIAYKAGMTQNVTAECATLAVAAGKAVRLKKTKKDEAPWQESEAGQGGSIDESSSSEEAPKSMNMGMSPLETGRT